MTKFVSKFLVIFSILFGVGLSFSNNLFAAGYNFFDAIEEFGERRYIRPVPARLKAGPVIFHPTLRTSAQYDSNIVRSDEDTVDDIIWRVRPGVIIEVPIDTHQITVGYEADFEIFTKTRSQTDQNQNLFALIDLDFPSWYINVLERFSETSGRGGTTFTGRLPRFDQSIHPKIGYRWNRFTVEAGYRHLLRDFRKDGNDRLDYQVNEWSSVIFFDLFPRLKVLADYTVAQIDYDDDFLRNGTFHQGRVGVEGYVMPNVRVEARVGPHIRAYEESERNDFKSWVADVLVEYQMREDLKFELEFERKPYEAEVANNNFYNQHLIRFGVEYEFMPRWEVYHEAMWYRHDYSETTVDPSRTSKRHDDHVRLDTGVRYDFRDWWEFELSYEYIRRDSNFATSDYTDNRLTLSSNLIY